VVAVSFSNFFSTLHHPAPTSGKKKRLILSTIAYKNEVNDIVK
jgi:hypothetical protein